MGIFPSDKSCRILYLDCAMCVKVYYVYESEIYFKEIHYKFTFICSIITPKCHGTPSNSVLQYTFWEPLLQGIIKLF
jgi:hypothetical protein